VACRGAQERFARLSHAAECRYESLSERLKARLIDLLENPTDPFDTRAQRHRERDNESLRRIT
jgi:hypothetical protein